VAYPITDGFGVAVQSRFAVDRRLDAINADQTRGVRDSLLAELELVASQAVKARLDSADEVRGQVTQFEERVTAFVNEQMERNDKRFESVAGKAVDAIVKATNTDHDVAALSKKVREMESELEGGSLATRFMGEGEGSLKVRIDALEAKASGGIDDERAKVSAELKGILAIMRFIVGIMRALSIAAAAHGVQIGDLDEIYKQIRNVEKHIDGIVD
jgi:hypothetical protein